MSLIVPKSLTETDPVFIAAPASGIAAGDITNWDTAYGWGNHGAAGYLTSFTETDPVFSAAPASGIVAGDISNWNTAYGWGNHAAAGYLDEYEEGTWTPVLGGFSGSQSGQSYSTQNGWYTKIGNLVTFGCSVSISTVGTITGAYLMVKGLPFTIGNIAGGVSIGYYNQFNINVYSMTSWLRASSTEVFLGNSDVAAGTVDLTVPSDIKNGSTLYLTGSYQT